MRKDRFSNIELFRCILMFMIVYIHFFNHGINEDLGKSKIVLEGFILALSSIAVDCYVLISGYFGINLFKENKFSIKKIQNLYFQIFFYSVVTALIAFALRKISVKSLAVSFFPVLTCKWWFASGYFFLCLFSPFLNEVIEKWWQSKYLYVLMGITMVVTFFLENLGIGTVTGFNSFGISTMAICYCTGRCLYFANKENKSLTTYKKSTYFFTYIGISTISYIIALALFFITKKRMFMTVYKYSSPLILIASISLFMFFLKLNVKQSKIINFIGSTTFGIYLLHENSMIKTVLYTYFNPAKYSSSFFIFIYVLLCSLLVFLAGIVIEIIRQYIFKFLQKLRPVSSN